MRDLVVMFRNLLVKACNRTTEPTPRAVVPDAHEVFDRKFHCNSPTSLRTGQDIGVQRAIARSKPFGAKRCAAATTIVDRQLQRLEQAPDLTARGETRCLLSVDAGHCLP